MGEYSDKETDTVSIPGLKKEDAAEHVGVRTLEQVRQLTQRVTDLSELLKTQREMLLKRGMNLPMGSLDNLRSLKTQIDGLSKKVVNTQRELGQLRALAETTALINSSLKPSVVLNQVMDVVIQLTGAERGYILLKNKDTGEFDEFAVARGIDQEQLHKDEFTVSRTVVKEVARTNAPILTDNAQDDPRLKDGASIANLKLLSILAVPLSIRDDIIGVVYVDNRVLQGIFTQQEAELAAAFGNQAAVAIENARLFESARANLAQVTEFRDFMNNIFTSITSGVITVDHRGVVITCNVAAERILYFTIADTPLGKPLQEVLPPLPDEFYERLERVRVEDTQEFIEVEPEFTEYGKRYWNMIASPLRDENGVGQGVAIVLDDLTEQKEHEARLAEVRRYLPTALVDNIRSIDDVNVGGEEREISAIFCDVRGFTTFSEKLDPEQLMQIINKYLSVASDAINLYEGIVDKYMGDAVTGLFNTQLNPQENHAERAVRAAMSILYDLYALHEILPEEQRLFYGIGIHTGGAMLGNVGSPDRKEFAALGEATDISKILQENAGPAEIIISAATYEAVKDLFDCEQTTPKKTKGRTDIDTVYKVLRRKKGATTGALFVDPELANLLKDLDTD
jgi:adenylate cyclase